jgi:hypothetical protein
MRSSRRSFIGSALGAGLVASATRVAAGEGRRDLDR